MSNWSAYKEGRSIGKVSTEGGIIMRDEEHLNGARITFKHGNDYISISCNLYGWMDHTRFFGTVADAQREYVVMKSALDDMMTVVSTVDVKEIKVWETISEFVRRFP